MGGCVSQVMVTGTQSWPSSDHPTAKIVSVNGVLREYPVPSYVSQVIQAEINSFSSSSSASSSVFICSSDKLGYDDYIPALDAEDQLQADQIYFVLPASKLRQRLTSSDMAALAVKATVALQKYASKNSGHLRRKNKARISPVTVVYQSVSFESTKINRFGYEHRLESQKNNRRPVVDAKPSSGLSQDGSSSRKLQRYRSRRTKTAVRSFRLSLSTIYEGTTAL
ncbi:uncharacterized protein LOC121263300 [Juglans microcarpa x Juglans regia]|uniref:uncharacterized protein LOC121263300 n=1 Tax=Juglans microcarpa x Juglans regia TaxID=2249226 RepID=UPI001B7F25AE|nr:uncharacterized protein LOC121263300 [Juglans microcarpa x Juglans regia]